MSKICPALLSMLLMTVLSFSVMSCSDDDDEAVTTQRYQLGFSSMSSGGNFLADMATIENTFKTVLGTDDLTFSMNGTASQCDKAVKEACDQAYEVLKSISFSGKYTFTATNLTTGNQVVTYTFGSN